jgi:hypothetical protein
MQITFSTEAHLAANYWAYSTVLLVPVTKQEEVKQMKDVLI